MERLGALDAGFLFLEDAHAPLHIGSVSLFEGPVVSDPELHALFERAAGRCPRYRQRLHVDVLGIGRPGWIGDPDFDLGYHLRRTALPLPGGIDELNRLVGRLMSTRLDPDRPLWEAWVVEALAEERWALVLKVHHSVVDGVGGMALFTELLNGRAVPLGAASSTRRPDGGLSILRPRRMALLARTGLRGAASYAGALRPTTATSLTGPLGSPRSFRTLTVVLSDVKRVREELGGSVNDVVITLVTRGLRQLLLSRGERPDRRAVRSLVPVSTRTAAPGQRPANSISALLVDLPVDLDDIRRTHQAVISRMNRLKHSSEGVAGQLGVGLADRLPAILVSTTIRALRRVPQRVITTVITNVPGPRSEIGVLGRRMVALYPYVPIADRVRIGIAVTSYAGRLHFGITFDRDSMPDADVLTAAIGLAFAELVDLSSSGQTGLGLSPTGFAN